MHFYAHRLKNGDILASTSEKYVSDFSSFLAPTSKECCEIFIDWVLFPATSIKSAKIIIRLFTTASKECRLIQSISLYNSVVVLAFWESEYVTQQVIQFRFVKGVLCADFPTESFWWMYWNRGEEKTVWLGNIPYLISDGLFIITTWSLSLVLWCKYKSIRTG